MSSTISGGISLASTLQAQITAGANVVNPYNIPVQPGQAASYTAGTGPNQAQKLAQLAGTTTVSTPLDVDLYTLACVDGSTGFAHVRELVILNLDPAIALTVGNDGVVANPWTAPWLGTTVRQLVQPGGHLRITKPLGTNGYVVDSTHRIVRIDPGAYAVPYQVLVLGD